MDYVLESFEVIPPKGGGTLPEAAEIEGFGVTIAIAVVVRAKRRAEHSLGPMP